MHHHYPSPISHGCSAGPRNLSSRKRTIATQTFFVLGGLCALFLASCASSGPKGQTSAERNFERRPYVGAGVLASRLDPGLEQFETLSVDEDQGAGGSFTLGYDFSSRIALEGHFASLGEATFAPEGEINYQVGGLTALIYGLNEPRDRSLREGLSIYARAGVGGLQADSDLPVELVNDVHLVLGGGLEYGFSNGLAARIELMSHDTDAQYGQLALVYRFKGFSSRAAARSPELVKPVPSQSSDTNNTDVSSLAESGTGVDSPVDEDIVISPTFRETAKPGVRIKSKPVETNGLLIKPRRDSIEPKPPAQAPVPAESQNDKPALGGGLLIQRNGTSRDSGNPSLGLSAEAKAKAKEKENALRVSEDTLLDEDQDGVADNKDACPDTTAGRPVNITGCDLFDGVVEGVTFQIASNRLTDSALTVLDEVAQTLKAYPLVRVSINAYTDDRGTASDNLLLSKRRALEVTRYLVAQGIAGNRLIPNAYGESEPIESNQTSTGRRANRRVEFRILE